jgi:hypothetical protein
MSSFHSATDFSKLTSGAAFMMKTLGSSDSRKAIEK